MSLIDLEFTRLGVFNPDCGGPAYVALYVSVFDTQGNRLLSNFRYTTSLNKYPLVDNNRNKPKVTFPLSNVPGAPGSSIQIFVAGDLRIVAHAYASLDKATPTAEDGCDMGGLDIAISPRNLFNWYRTYTIGPSTNRRQWRGFDLELKAQLSAKPKLGQAVVRARPLVASVDGHAVAAAMRERGWSGEPGAFSFECRMIHNGTTLMTWVAPGAQAPIVGRFDLSPVVRYFKASFIDTLAFGFSAKDEATGLGVGETLELPVKSLSGITAVSGKFGSLVVDLGLVDYNFRPEILGIEVTQAVQRFGPRTRWQQGRGLLIEKSFDSQSNNDLVLVNDKDVLVRLYLDSGLPPDLEYLVLKGATGDVQLSVGNRVTKAFPLNNQTLTIESGEKLDRSLLSQSLNFVVGRSEIRRILADAGAKGDVVVVSVEATVRAPGYPIPIKASTTARFRSLPALRVFVVGVQVLTPKYLTGPNPLPAPGEFDCIQAIERAMDLLPLQTINYAGYEMLSTSIEFSDDWAQGWQLTGDIEDLAEEQGDSDPTEKVIGCVPPIANREYSGLTSISRDSCWCVLGARNQFSMTIPHEMCHTFGVDHNPGCTAPPLYGPEDETRGVNPRSAPGGQFWIDNSYVSLVDAVGVSLYGRVGEPGDAVVVLPNLKKGQRDFPCVAMGPQGTVWSLMSYCGGARYPYDSKWISCAAWSAIVGYMSRNR